MRCPRNYIHVNLFVTFCLRTVSIMVVDMLRQNTEIFKISQNSSDKLVDDDPVSLYIKLVITQSILKRFMYFKEI